MRTLVDIEEAEIRALEAISKRESVSRAALIRKAIREFLDRRAAHDAKDSFGLWGKGKTDGLDYQEKARSEW